MMAVTTMITMMMIMMMVTHTQAVVTMMKMLMMTAMTVMMLVMMGAGQKHYGLGTFVLQSCELRDRGNLMRICRTPDSESADMNNWGWSIMACHLAP